MGGNLGGDLGGGGGHGVQDHLEHEGDKRRGVSRASAFLQGLVVLGLVRENQAFHRKIGKQGMPVGQDQALPQPAHATVAVGKGMDKFELVMKNRTLDERVGVAGAQPAEQVGHQLRHPGRGRGHVDHLPARHHPHAAAPVAARLIDQAGHQYPVRLQQILFRPGPPGVEAVIGGQGILDLLHRPRRGDHPLALQNRGDLRLAQGIALDGQRPVNGADTVDAPQPQGSRLIGEHGQSPDSLADRGDTVQDLGGDGIGWLVVHIPHCAAKIAVSLASAAETNRPCCSMLPMISCGVRLSTLVTLLGLTAFRSNTAASMLAARRLVSRSTRTAPRPS